MERAVKRSGGVGKKCQNMRQEVNCLSERQEIIRGMLEDKFRMQSRATDKYYDQIFEEMKELEEKKSEEALLLVQKKFDLWRFQNERDEARSLHGSGSSRRMKMEADSQDFLSVQSCRSSAVDGVEEISLESSRKRKDVQGVMSEFAGKEMRERREDAWRLDPEGETKTLETKVVSHGMEGVDVDPKEEGRHERGEVKNSRRQSEAPGEEGEEIKSPKRKIFRVESEETQDYVRVTNEKDQEEGEETSVVTISAARRPSASGSWRKMRIVEDFGNA